MIIQSVRLKNMKSYGEGPDGNGVTVQFQPGVNRIAGLNGHGKTTLIECIGYALFLSEPIFLENFKVETYFLSNGAKFGEIDVTFDYKSEIYRVERGVGAQSGRRTKVIQLSDGSICAEGDKEVANFLCRLLELPDPSRMSELFAKLIGVKQGRLAWPFDSKPSSAKDFFEPLLEVEVFRQCFDRMKPVVDGFKQERSEKEIKEAGVKERIKERADSQVKFKNAVQTVSDKTMEVENNVKARDNALREKKKQEAFEKAFNEAAMNKEKAVVVAETAKANRVEAEKRVKESEQSARTVIETKSAHDIYETAEKTLKDLEIKRKKRDGLRLKRDKSESDNQNRKHKAQAARDQVAVFVRQKKSKEGNRDALSKKIAPLQRELESSKRIFDQTQEGAETADLDRAAIKAWVQGLPGLVRRLRPLAGDIASVSAEVVAWDPSNFETAKNAEKQAAEALTAAKKQLAKALERKDTLAGQLKQIKGGTCPFLKENCHQFEPAKVKSDLSKLDADIIVLEKKEKAALRAHDAAQSKLTPLVTADNQLAGKRAQLAKNIRAYRSEYVTVYPKSIAETIVRLKAWLNKIAPFRPEIESLAGTLSPTQVPLLQESLKAFVDEVKSWWDKAELIISDRLKEIKQEKADRVVKEENLKSAREELKNVEQEIEGLARNEKEKEKEARKFDEEAAAFKIAVEAFDDQLKPYASLDKEIESTATLRDGNKAGHERCLKAKALAEDLTPRRRQLNERKQAEDGANVALKKSENVLRETRGSFNVDNLKAARLEYDKKLGEATVAETNLVHAKAELSKQEVRFNEWKEACREQAQISQEIARIDAAIDLTELARKTLRDAAPAVAQHICNRIAARAQVVFNRINPDPVELTWDAERYSLRITPGDRRFAMLSGGEQTKLALAMTLAMVEEFSGLRFCIFDEPTYGVDADSRSKLADAILEVHKAAGLDQLLLVSHDDAFEGKVEHAILLKKSAVSGTVVLQTQ